MALRIPLDSIDARQQLGDLGRQFDRFPGELGKVIVRALNRTLKGASTQAVKLMSDRYNVKAGEAKRKVKEFQASRSRQVIRLEATGRPILLSRFGAKRKAVKAKRSAYTYERRGKTVSVGESKVRTYQGVTVKVLRAGRSRLIKGAFMGKPKNGVEMIFKNMKGEKLEVLRGPSIASFLARPEIEETIRSTAMERLARELKREAEFKLSKLMK